MLKTTPAAPLPSLPDDILYTIFRISATEYGPEQRDIITLVSRGVQRWVDPLIFHNIRIDYDIGLSIPVLLCQAWASNTDQIVPRMARVLHSTRSISMEVSPEALHEEIEDLQNLFSIFPQLSTLFADTEYIPGKVTWDCRIPSLRHLSWCPSQKFSPLLYRSLVHLRIQFMPFYGVNVREFAWKCIPALTSLQYLSVDTQGDPVLLDMVPERQFIEVERLLSPCSNHPSLQAILWCPDIDRQDWQSCQEVLRRKFASLKVVWCVNIKGEADDWPFIFDGGNGFPDVELCARARIMTALLEHTEHLMNSITNSKSDSDISTV
ncbi:hypothetical protein DL96DRAFT_1714048 [Flagelloscypha sp. PMI_526]|nr:hypothetical protein DL96DRAFT_1714048 [Flagelloscypha sp. PMI_526]